jgi:hypothetical protein
MAFRRLAAGEDAKGLRLPRASHPAMRQLTPVGKKPSMAFRRLKTKFNAGPAGHPVGPAAFCPR